MTARVEPAGQRVSKRGVARGRSTNASSTDLRGRRASTPPHLERAAAVGTISPAATCSLPTQTNDEAGSAAWRLVGPGYFAALGIPIRGREFTMQDSDRRSAGGDHQRGARRRSTSRTTIRSDASLVMRSFSEDPHTIVGVAGDVQARSGSTQDAGFVFYGSATQYAGWNPMSLVWRSPRAIRSPVRHGARVAALDRCRACRCRPSSRWTR